MTMEISWTDCGTPFETPKYTCNKITVKGDTWQEALQKAVYEIEFLSSSRKVTDIRPRVVDF